MAEAPFDEHFEHIADSMGISLYQRFTPNEAALFLRCPEPDVKQLVKARKINCIELGPKQVQFFGYQLLEFVLGQVTEHQIAPVSLNQPSSDQQIVRAKEVVELTGLSRTTIWRLEKAGDFPSRVQLGIGAIGWLKADILQWISSRKAV